MFLLGEYSGKLGNNKSVRSKQELHRLVSDFQFGLVSLGHERIFYVGPAFNRKNDMGSSTSSATSKILIVIIIKIIILIVK